MWRLATPVRWARLSPLAAPRLPPAVWACSSHAQRFHSLRTPVKQRTHTSPLLSLPPRPATAVNSVSLTLITCPHARHRYSNAQGGGQRGGRDNQALFQLVIIGARALARYLPFLWRSGAIHSFYRRHRFLTIAFMLLPLGLVVVFIVTHLSLVPYTNRLHLTFLGSATEMNLGEQAYNEVLAQERNRLLSPSLFTVKQIERVSADLITVARTDGVVPPSVSWEVNVIESNVANAFVLPNGRIFVYTGILPVASTMGGLAVILGHEISHALAHHSVEKMGVVSLLLIAYDFTRGWIDSAGQGGIGSSIVNFIATTIVQTVLPLAHSRKMEVEADRMGLIVMAKAGYDPSEGVRVWERMKTMEELKKQGKMAGKLPEFLSTHPSYDTRIDNMRRWADEFHHQHYLPAVEQARLQGKRLPSSSEPITYRPTLSQATIDRMDEEAQSAMLGFQASALAVGEFGQLVNVK